MQLTVSADGVIFGADYITCGLHIINIDEAGIESLALSLIFFLLILLWEATVINIRRCNI